ncbi:hypothetical protein JW887_01565 [Candidatus Dojkabacteria bacterium]|nr:hypothetical protein [Candidatus Dojkabacteria bacterium]
MFSFPGQTEQDLKNDLEKISKMNVNQVTVYPLFTFPYSSIGEYLKIKKVKMPGFSKRYRFYNIIYDFFQKNKYEMTSVWSFNKNSGNLKYSSVTRDKYLGIGAGAASRFDNIFYFNTFSVRDYEKRLMNNRLPIAIDMPILKSLSDWYWFYWRLYETKFTLSEYENIKTWKIDLLLKIFLLLKLCEKVNGTIQLTRRGAFWLHLAQNYFVLNYINNVWTVMKKEPFPDFIRI